MSEMRITSPEILQKIESADEAYKHSRFNEAIEILNSLTDMVDDSFKYDKCEIYRKLGNNYYALKDYDNAIWAYEKTLNYYSNNSSIFNVLGYIYFYRDKDKSIYYYLKGMELNPDFKNFVMLTQIMIKSKNYTQKDLKETFEKYVNYFRDTVLDIVTPFEYNPKDYSPDKKLRIGYMSSDFRCHAMMTFTLPILENHHKDKFEIYLYSCGKKYDYVTERIKGFGYTFKDCSDMDYFQLANTINDDRIDILVDLGGYTHDAVWSLLFKPAPVIVQFLGFLGTYGMKEVDYILCDEFTIPRDIAKYYTEKPMYIESGMNRYDFNTKNQKLPDITPLPYDTNKYITFGSFNCMSKINPYTVKLWSRILKAVPDSKLLIYRTQLQQRDIDRFTTQFTQNGIDINRIKFDNTKMPINHFQCYNLCDIALDPSPFSGLTVTIEEAFMGVPLLTLIGETISARGASRVNLTLGLDNLVAYSEDELVEKAVALASDPDKLRYYRANLRNIVSESKFCTDYDTYINQIEDAYVNAWKDFCSGRR